MWRGGGGGGGAYGVCVCVDGGGVLCVSCKANTQIIGACFKQIKHFLKEL